MSLVAVATVLSAAGLPSPAESRKHGGFGDAGLVICCDTDQQKEMLHRGHSSVLEEEDKT